MARLPIHWIEARTHCHATEEEERVLAALNTACPGKTLSREVVMGHFGNPLVVFRRRLATAEEIRVAWSRWKGAGVLAALEATLEERTDKEAVLHFRLDKQRAFLGTVVLASGGDPIDIRVKLKAFSSRHEETLEAARAALREAT